MGTVAGRCFQYDRVPHNNLPVCPAYIAVRSRYLVRQGGCAGITEALDAQRWVSR